MLQETIDAGEANEEALFEYQKNNEIMKAMDDMLKEMQANVSGW